MADLNPRQQYSNPVIAGFYPDPSVCRVSDDFYLATSSFEYFPGVSIFHSRDLVHWRQVGHALTRNSQVKIVGSSAGIYAPTLRHHSGRFYMTTTSIGGGGNFYVWTDDPAGEWSEPNWVDQGGIDPSLLFDNGAVYFTSEGGDGIQQCEIDIETGRRLSESRVIWPGTGGRNPEAPHLYKIYGLYYLMIAEGGTEYGHMETIARSDSPWGPFEPCPHNPILTHRNRSGHPIQATGHADLVQVQDGSWWAVFLGTRPAPNVYPPWHNRGRETFLAPVAWTEEGWPTIGNAGTVELIMDAPAIPSQPWSPEPERDDFSGNRLALAWNFRGNPSTGKLASGRSTA